MSDQTSQDASVTITTQDVLDYLHDNPKFLSQHPEAIDLLKMPTMQAGKGVADFQSYMIERLKADKEEVEQTAREIIANARSNMNNQQRIHSAVLRILEATTFDDFIQCLTMDLASMMGVDISALIVEADDGDIPHIHNSGIRIMPSGTLNSWMGDKNVLMQENISGIEAIYGSGATLIQSQILLRIDVSLSTPPAILAFGSRDPNMFSADQATDQILFLARVIERAFRTWLHLPQMMA